MDIGFRFRKTREELTRFQQRIRSKMLRRDELQKQIEATEGRMQQMRVLEMDLRKSKSLLIRTEMEIKRLLAEKSRLQRELPLIESEIRKVEMERRFGANKGDLISRE